jgi:uncharacterized membrane protein
MGRLDHRRPCGSHPLRFFVGQVVAIVWISLALAIVDGREIASDTLLALRHSSHITSGNRWSVFVFLLAALALNIVGVLLLVVGVLVTSAVTLIADAHVYRQLDGSLQPAI